MEFIGDILEPHADLLATIASSLTFVQLLSPVPMFNTIRKKNSSSGFPFMPFIGGIVLSVLNLQFGAIIGDSATVKVNLLGFAVNVIYICMFYFYTPAQDKNRLWGQIGLAGLLAVACVIYCNYEDPKKLELRIGFIITVWMVILVGSPFLHLGKILRNKSVGNMPISIVLSGTTMSVAWTLYAFAIRNAIIVTQGLILGSMGATQIMLYIIYPPKPIHSADLKKKKDK